MDWQLAIEAVLGLLATAGAVTAVKLAKAKKNLAAEMVRALAEAKQERETLQQNHVSAMAAAEACHEAAVLKLEGEHAIVVAAHMAVADQLRSDIVTLKEEHLIALDKAEQEKIAAVAKVEGKITSFRDRQRELIDEIFGPEEAAVVQFAAPVAVLKPAVNGQMVVTQAEEAEVVAAPVAAKIASDLPKLGLKSAMVPAEPTKSELLVAKLREQRALAAAQEAELQAAIAEAEGEPFAAQVIETEAAPAEVEEVKAPLPWLQGPLEA